MVADETKVSRRGFLSYAVTAIVVGVVAGVGGYYAGLSSAPPPGAPTTVTRTVTPSPVTTTVTSPPVTSTVTVTAPTPPTPPPPKETYDPKMIEAAKKEGKVVVYYNMLSEHFEAIKKEFETRFTGVKVEGWRGAEAAFVAKALSEYYGNVNAVDVLWSSQMGTAELFEKGVALGTKALSDSIVLPEAFPKGLVLEYGYGSRLLTFVISYNTKLVPAGKEPQTLEDLAKPEWKGKITATDLTLHDTSAYWFMDWRKRWGEEKFWNFMKGFLANQPIWRESVTPTSKAIEVGDGAVGFGYAYHAVDSINRGAPVYATVTNPSSGPATPLALATKAPHPNAGKLFIQFMVTTDGMKALQMLQQEVAAVDESIPVHPILKAVAKASRTRLTLYSKADYDKFIAELKKLL